MEEYEYDFAYECRRLVEAMAPRSARSFRQEFNMQDVATTEHTYTTYTTEKYVRTSHSTEIDGHGQVKSMANGKLTSPSYPAKTVNTDEDRPDVRKLKRVHKMYEGPNIIESRGRLLSSPETRQTMTIEQAAKEGLIDPKLAARLTGPCGMTEDGNEVTLLEAIQRELYDAEQGLTDPAEKRIKVTVEGMPDKLEISEVEQQSVFDDQSALEPVQVIPGVIFDPATALVISTTSGISETILEAIDRGVVASNTVKVLEPRTQERISIKEAVERGIIDKRTGEYKDISGKKLTLSEATKVGLVAVLGAPLVAASKVIQVVKNTMIADPTTGENIPMEVAYERGLVDYETYKKYEDSLRDKSPEKASSSSYVEHLPTNEVHERGFVDQNVQEKTETSSVTTTSTVSKVIITKIMDPKTGEQLSINDAYERGIVDPATYSKYQEKVRNISPEDPSKFKDKETTLDVNKKIFSIGPNKPMSVGAAVSEGFITVESIQNSLLADTALKGYHSDKKINSHPTEVIHLDTSNTDVPSVTPKYNINVSKESRSEVVESKPVILSKIRKRVITPMEAIEKGLIDEDTAKLLNSVKEYKDEKGMPITLKKAIDIRLVDGDEGSILDPVHGDSLSIKEAIKRGILDEECQDEILIPIAKSLSITDIMQQGLWDPTCEKIIHPENGTHLTLREAIICDIVDPLTSVTLGPGKRITLTEAIERNLIDSDKNFVRSDTGVLDLLTAVNANLFPQSDDKMLENIPPAAMTLSVAIQRGLINSTKGDIKHPLTGEVISIDEAVDKNLLMGIPYPQTSDTIPLKEAIDKGIVNLINSTFTNPETNEVIPLEKAMEQGLLAIKRDVDISDRCGVITTVTETFTSQHTVTTKMVELLADYILLSASEVQNTKTGEVISIDEARIKGIIRDEQVNKELFLTNDSNISFNDALMLGYIDLEKGTFTDPNTGEVISVTEAVNSGILNTEVLSEIAHKKITKDLEMLDLSQAFDTLYDEKTQKFRDPKSPNNVLTFEEALENKVINPDSVIYKLGSDKPMTLQEAVETGVLDKKSGKIKEPGTGKSLDVKKAAKLGLLAVVAAPVLAGMAVVQGAKAVTSKVITPKEKEVISANLTNVASDQTELHKETIINKSDGVKIPPSNKQESNLSKSKINERKVDDKSRSLEALQKSSLEDISNKIGSEVVSKEKIRNEESAAQGSRPEIKVNERNTDLVAKENILLSQDRNVQEVDIKHSSEYSDKDHNDLKDSQVPCTQDQRENLHGGEVTLSKFIVSSKPTEITREHSSTVVTKISNVTTIETNQNQSSYKVTEEIHIPSKSSSDQQFVELPDQTDRIVSDITEDVIASQDIPTQELISADSKQHMEYPKGKNLKSNDKKFGNQNYEGDIVQKNKFDQSLKITSLTHDPKTNIIISTSSDIVDIPTALQEGAIPVESIKVVDPVTGNEMSIRHALDSGIVDEETSKLLTTSAKSESQKESYNEEDLKTKLGQAVKLGLVAVVGAPIIAASKMVDVVKSSLKEDEEKVSLEVTKKEGSHLPDHSAEYKHEQVVYVREPLTFEQALENGHLNLNTARFTDPQSKEVLTVKDAATLGYIDSDTALIKDNLKKRLVKLPEAFRKGLMDAEKGNILDTETSKLNTLSAAIDSGLLMTPKKSFSLIETLNFGIYNPTTGALNDPFITTSVIDRKRLTLGEAIQQGIVDPSSTVVKEPETGKILPLTQAVEQQLINPLEGRLIIDPKKGISLDLVKALKKGYLLPAETRQAVEEKYRLCDDTLSKLLEWIADVEGKLANQEPVKESMDELRNQINLLKMIKDDLEGHQRQVSACADQAKQLLVSGGDVLAPHEVAALERGVRQLKQRYDRCTERCDKMLRRLTAARDELGKFTSELSAFESWMEGAYRSLEDKEAALSNLDNLPAHSEEVREFVSDVIAHQADLRFITMSAQKFIDESKEFRARGDGVRDAAGSARRRHSELAARAQRLLERLRAAHAALQRHRNTLQRAQRWMQELEPQVRSALDEAVGGDPRAVEEQLQRIKALQNEILAQGRLIDNAKEACEQLLNSLEGSVTPSEIRQLEAPVAELAGRYHQLGEAVAARCSALEAALLQCQGLQDAVEAQAAWLAQAEDAFKAQQTGASLLRERLDEQVREQRAALAAAEARRAALAALLDAARQAARAPSNARLARKLEQRADDIYARYEKLVERLVKRGQFLEEVGVELGRFSQQAARLEAAHAQLLEIPDSRLHEQAAARDKQMPLLEECVRTGKQLLAKKDVTDTHVVRDRIKALESLWRDFNTSLEEKQKLSKQRADQLSQYESLRTQVVEWLQSMEERVCRLQPVAVEPDALRAQHDELRPFAKEHRDMASAIDKVNEAGAIYENLTRGDRADSPHRKRQIYSPTKRQTPTRSLDARSPSPGKGHLVSPGSHSASSGFSSRRSSQDGFHLEDLSPVQQQLSDINNRYGLLGSKLSDRQAEIDSIREEIKKHLDNLRTLNNFLDKVQRQMPKESIPNTKEEADKTIKQARAVLEEMYEKQSLLDSTKTQVRELLKRKQGVQGADRLHDEMEDIASRWKSLHDAFKDKIRLMEEMKDFHDTSTNLSQWLSAKERMMAALGPISSDSRMVQTQVQQVQVLREEFRGQQPQLSHLQEVGAAALQRLRHDSPDAQALQAHVRRLTDHWDALLAQLERRAESLGAAADTCRELDAGLARLRGALQAIAERLDAAPQHPADERLRCVQNLERQLEGQRPLLADLEAAGEALGAVLGESSARQDVASKLAGAVRHFDALQRRLDMAKAEAEAALRDGRNLEESVAKTLGWLQTELAALPARLQVSAAKARLQQQLERHEPLYRDLTRREHEIIMLLDKGREMEKKPSHQGLRKDLDRIQTQWDKLKRETVDRYNRLQTAMEHCRKYGKAQESFLPWLAEAEERLEKLPPAAFTKKEVEKQLRELQQIRNDIWKRSGEFENNKTLGETFISSCDVDQEVVRKQIDGMKETWDKINNHVLQQAEFLEGVARLLAEWGERVRAVEAPLARCEERLAALQAQPTQPARRALDAAARLADQLHALQAPLQVTLLPSPRSLRTASFCAPRKAW
ncbi:unnamed protein product, partial [Iphiclides podalirius]